MSKIITGNVGNAPPTPLEQKQQYARLLELLKNSTGIKCDSCAGQNFIEVVRMRKVSGLANGTGQDMIIPVPIYACANCGNVNEFFSKSTGLPADVEADNTDTPTMEAPDASSMAGDQ